MNGICIYCSQNSFVKPGRKKGYLSFRIWKAAFESVENSSLNQGGNKPKQFCLVLWKAAALSAKCMFLTKYVNGSSQKKTSAHVLGSGAKEIPQLRQHSAFLRQGSLFFNKRSVEQLQLDCRPDKGLLFIHGQSSLLVPKQIISTPHTPPSWHNTLRLITHNWRGGAEGLAKPLCPEDKWSVYEALGWGNNFLYISRERTKKISCCQKTLRKQAKQVGSISLCKGKENPEGKARDEQDN